MVPKSHSAKQIKDLCASALDELKAHNINAFEVEKISSFASEGVLPSILKLFPIFFAVQVKYSLDNFLYSEQSFFSSAFKD